MTMLHFQTLPHGLDRAKLTEFAAKFDHTNLKPTSGRAEIERLCDEAAEYQFATVCVAPRWVKPAADWLSGHNAESVLVCTVVGFPHGNTTTEAKSFETSQAIEAGASEIDMVVSIGDLKDGNDEFVARDISAVVEAAHARQAIVKVILEAAFLETEQVKSGCRLAVRAGADYVKTSTGFASSGADASVVRLMRETVGNDVGVKAAGGIKTLADARTMLDAGASRLGCSASVQIMQEFIRQALRQGG